MWADELWVETDGMIMYPWFTAAPLLCLTRILLCAAEEWDGGGTPPTHIQCFVPGWDMCIHTALVSCEMNPSAARPLK